MENGNIRNMTVTALVTAVVCVLGPIVIPTAPIPFSLQVFSVFLAVCVLGAKRGTVAIALYLLIGAVGVPVFAGFAGGAARFVAPAGGFLVGFIPLAVISGIFIDRFPDRPLVQFAGMLIGLAVLYAFGTAWLIALTKFPLEKALKAAVYPFVAIDCAKAVLAIIVGRAVKKRIKV